MVQRLKRLHHFIFPTVMMVFGSSVACNVKWIGLRGDDLNLIPEESLVPLKAKDSQIAKSLLSSKILQVSISVIESTN